MAGNAENLGGRLWNGWSEPAEILLLNGFFVDMFAILAVLFRKAARGGPERGAA